ncbi:glycosyltransferase family 4 protein [Leuconostoc sp. MS02]|uniref:Glycosyltransferase family 4 protein n=1 Tax=Leuconostoc aquikimchii TaxID=3236804 RepID=A0ABV3S3K4_9LACO
MKIQFVLPPNYNQAVGGYKIVFQYANWLSDRGHDVHIYFMLLDEPIVISLVRQIKRKLLGQSTINNTLTWYKLSEKVTMHYNVSHRVIESISDGILVATFFKTAKNILNANVLKNDKYYLIQDYEIFAGSQKDVDTTWRYDLKKIVISEWLLKKSEELGVSAELVPNFIDDAEFYPVQLLNENPIVSMLWHENPRKKSILGLEAIKLAKKQIPNLKAIFFGKGKAPADFPNWITYYQNATITQLREKIYGQSTLYLMTSDFEGWGLTAMEAMAVNIPVISTENGGIRNFANDDTAFIIPINDLSEMSHAIVTLINDDDKRAQLKNNATKKIQDFTLTNSGHALEKEFAKY